MTWTEVVRAQMDKKLAKVSICALLIVPAILRQTKTALTSS